MLKLPRSRAARLGGQAAVLVTLVSGTAAYAANDTTVHLSVDGQQHDVRVFGRTVADVLDTADVSVGKRDVVAPARSERIVDGSQVVVQHARQITLTVDGTTQTRWTTALTVDEALDELDVRADGARLSASRSAPLGRTGLTLDVITPKDVSVLVDGQSLPVVTTAATVRELLAEVGVTLNPQDRLSVPAESPLAEGLLVQVTRMASGNLVEQQALAFETQEKPSDELYTGERRVEQRGTVGIRTVTYTQLVADGVEVGRVVASDVITAEPVTQIVLVGTKEKPATALNTSGAPAVADGSVWDRLAQCEAGGNWYINTGNGYYGGLQFSASSWRAVGGTGLPHQNSREVQIQMGERLQAAQGWGAWPSCSRQLGLR